MRITQDDTGLMSVISNRSA